MLFRLSAISVTILFTAIFCGKNVMAQKTTGYQSISTAEGLSQGMVFDILQDKEGFIWVATKNGLNRYDGYGFKVFTNDPYNPNTLSSNTILKIFEDSKGHIWVGTENAGLNVYNKKSGKFYRLVNKVSDALSISGNAIRLIEELPDGRILVSAAGAGFNIIKLPPDFFDKQSTPVVTRLTLPDNTDVYGMGKDKSGTMWIGSMDESIYRFEPSKNNFVKLPAAQLLNSGYVTSDSSIIINNNLFLYNGKDAIPLFDQTKSPAGNIIFRPRDKPWEYHHRELYYYDVSWWQPGKPVKWDVQLPAKTRLVYPFIIDRSGILWSGSVGYGLRKYNTAGSKFKMQFPEYSVRWIIPASKDEVYLGDFSYTWRLLSKDSIVKSPFAKIPDVTQIDNFIITKAGDYWIKSDNKGYFNYNPSSGKLTAHPEINKPDEIGDKQPILEDSKGYIWFARRGGPFIRVHGVNGKLHSFTINTNSAKPMLPKAITTALFEDAQGVFWVGTQDGFAKLVFNTNNSSPQVTWFYNNSSNRNSLNYNHVSTFMNDPAEPNKYLWIGTKGGGLNRLDKATGDFFHLTTKDGLPDDVVYGILPDDAGNIWGSTNKGIFCLASPKKNIGKWMFRNFTKAEGLQDDEFNTGAYAKLSNGNLAFGGVNGLNIFNPEEVLAKGFTPNVFITDILINNQSIYPGDKTAVLQNTIEQSKNVTLNYQQDILTLEFSSLDFTAPVQNKYRYQLVGADEDWVESGTRRSATYLHLPSGSYVFKVQGSNSQGIWSDKISEIKITVLPPWWRTWWAYTIYVLLIALSIRGYLKFYINRAKLKAQLNFEKVEAKRIKELDTVKTQLYTNITHEFRTPLTVILGTAQQLVSKPTENFNNAMNMIVRNGQSLLKLVNEMLDLSKLETGNMSLQLTNGNVINFLSYVTESFQSLAEGGQKGLHFLTDIDALYVAYDAEKLRQIVVNLLSNALKFTNEKGNVYITISKNNIEGDDLHINLVIKVKDTGIGIPENQLRNIFDRFYQVDNSHTRAAEGTGIGLSLTKELVKLMGGDISVKSPPTGTIKGSEFTVVLPLQMATAHVEAANHFESGTNEGALQNGVAIVDAVINKESVNGDKPLLLLVEDNADVVAYTASCLPDYRLAVGKDGKEGFQIATDIIPDLIITDVMMPFVDGFEMTKRLRADERTSHIPIIMLTAKADKESRIEGLVQGADAYLQKPFYEEELLVRIKKLLELRENLQQHYLKKLRQHDDTPAEANIAQPTASENKVEDAFVKKVREAVEANLSDSNFNVEKLCRLVFLSHSQLHRKLEAITGLSPNKFIRAIRINKAKELLINPSNSIASIAYECGYSDAGYFSRVFKQEYNVTPQEWRLNKTVVQ